MNSSQEKKTVVIKTLAILGFFATIALGVWLLVQAVRVAPGAFSSLASIMESIQVYRPTNELTIATEKSIVNSGESFKLSWTDLRQNGEYEFSYPCTEGVSLDVRSSDGGLVTIPCENALALPSDVHGLFVSITSEKGRFIDVPFTISFKNERGDEVAKEEAKMTVVNATIPLAQNSGTTGATTTPTTTKPAEPVTPSRPTTPTQVASPIAATPSVTTTYVSYTPQSDPKGFVDLKVSFVGVGVMEGNSYVPAATYDPDERGALRFEVKNVGTKTSADWTFIATLPDGVKYESPEQTALKPNERVVFTLGFTMDPDTRDKYAKLGVSLTEKSDVVKSNNSFTWSVEIQD